MNHQLCTTRYCYVLEIDLAILKVGGVETQRLSQEFFQRSHEAVTGPIVEGQINARQIL